MLDLKPKMNLEGLVDALDSNMRPKTMVISGKSMPMGSPLGQPPGKHDHDREMVLNRLRSINRMSQILEEMACGCEPMPSWAEAKIYSAAKDLQGVLGYLLGDKPI